MGTIRINFYQDFIDIPAYETIHEAMNSTPPTRDQWKTNGYAVLFELGGQYAVYLHNEDRYYSSYIPQGSHAVFGGWWKKGNPIKWEPISNLSAEEQRLMDEWFKGLAT